MASSATIALLVAGIVVAAAGAGYGAYSANQAAQDQASAARRMARVNAENEANAGAARAAQIQYNADKMRKSFLSREAGAGVVVGQGSLLETEAQFNYDTQYSKDLAKYPHELAGYSDKYQGDLFGWQKSTAAEHQGIDTGVSAAGAAASAYKGSSLATINSSTRYD